MLGSVTLSISGMLIEVRDHVNVSDATASLLRMLVYKTAA